MNTILLKDKGQRDEFLKRTNEQGVMTRPVWDLMSTLPMFESCEKTSLVNSEYLAERLVNVPSSVIV